MGNRIFPKREWSGGGNLILKPIVRSNIPKLQYDMGEVFVLYRALGCHGQQDVP